MNILFIGSKSGNSYLTYKTLKKIYKKVDLINIDKSLIGINFLLKVFIHISSILFKKYFFYFILNRVNKNYDLIYVRAGEVIGKNLIIELKKRTKKIIFFCNDNPFVERDKRKWDLFKESSKLYDLIVFQDESRMKSSKKYGLKNTYLVYPPYDKKIHSFSKNCNVKKKYDVVFVGTWSPKKSQLLKKLILSGLNLKIFGTRWHKDKDFELIKSHYIPGHLNYKNYSRIIHKSKIALCLFSEENKDSITARSIEIPAIGTLMLSMRTTAMQKIFKENKEAIYFSNYKECLSKCKFFLSNTKLRDKISKKAKIKITKTLKLSNNDLVKQIINQSFKFNAN